MRNQEQQQFMQHHWDCWILVTLLRNLQSPDPYNTNWADLVNLHSPADDVTTICVSLHYSMSWIQTNGQSILK